MDGEDRPQPLIEKDHSTTVCEAAGQGRRALVRRRAGPAIDPVLGGGSILRALREGEQRPGGGAADPLRPSLEVGASAGAERSRYDHSSLCVFRAPLLALKEEGRLFRVIVSRAVKAVAARPGQLSPRLRFEARTLLSS